MSTQTIVTVKKRLLAVCLVLGIGRSEAVSDDNLNVEELVVRQQGDLGKSFFSNMRYNIL